jgi:hypothetical protein
MQMSMISSEFRHKPFLTAALFGAVLFPSPAFADALQQQVLAGAKATTGEDFAFTQMINIQRSGEAAKDYVMRYDPKRAKGARWTLTKAEGRAPTAKEASSFAKRANAAPVPSYGEIAKWFGGPATRVATSNDSVTYRFAALPAGTIKMPGQDISAHTSAEAVVNIAGPIPFVERVRITANKSFRIMMVAKIERFSATAFYQMLPGGRPAIIANASDLSGSMMGKSGTFKTRTSFSDMRWVR